MADFSVSFATSALERRDSAHINSAINAFLRDGAGDEALLAEGRAVQGMQATDRYSVEAEGKLDAQVEFLTRVIGSLTTEVVEDDDDE